MRPVAPLRRADTRRGYKQQQSRREQTRLVERVAIRLAWQAHFRAPGAAVSARHFRRIVRLLAPDLREFVRVQPDAAALRTFVDFDGDRCGKPVAQHHDAPMVRAVQPDRVVDQRGRELGEMGDERVAKRAVRAFQPGELEAIEPEAAAVLTDVGVDAADPERAKRRRGARASEWFGGHVAGSPRLLILAGSQHCPSRTSEQALAPKSVVGYGCDNGSEPLLTRVRYSISLLTEREKTLSAPELL